MCVSVWLLTDLHGCSTVCNGNVWSLLQRGHSAAFPGSLQVVTELRTVQRQSKSCSRKVSNT